MTNNHSVPKGAVALIELIERGVMALHGEDAIAPVEVYMNDNNDLITVRNGGQTRYLDDAERWDAVKNLIHVDLRAGRLVAHHGPDWQRKIRSYWDMGCAWRSFETGLTEDYEANREIIYFEESDALKWIANLPGAVADKPAETKAAQDPEHLPKAPPPKAEQAAWMQKIADDTRIKGERIAKPDFVKLYLKVFPRAPVDHAKGQYRFLPDDVRNPPNRPRKPVRKK